jgi:hypothetical protein
MRQDLLKVLGDPFRQRRLKEVMKSIKCISPEPVDPLDFFFADWLKGCHMGLLGLGVVRRVYMSNPYCLKAKLRIKAERRITMNDGSQTHWSSLTTTASPHLLKKALTPIGETSIGVQGKKYLVL